MLSGQWHGDAQARMRLSLGASRSTAIQDVDISSNIFSQVCNTLSVLYDADPVVSHPDPEAAERMGKLLSDYGYTSMMQGVQRYTLGLREMIIHVSALPTGDPDDPVGIVLRPVFPDLVVAAPDPRSPANAIRVTECQLSRDAETGKERWYWETTDADPRSPSYRLVNADTGFDQHGDQYVDDQYPWFDLSGQPILPYIVYHAGISHHLWDFKAWSELVEGTLSVAVDRSAYRYSLRTASFSQRYLINATIPHDLDAQGNGTLVADPSIIFLFKSDPESGAQPVAGQWSAPFAPDVIQAAVSQDEARLASNAGIPASDLLRLSGDPRSGYAIALSREGRREASRKFEAAFRKSDTRLLTTIAKMCNSVLGYEHLPEKGWSISYTELPLTEQERTTRDDRVIAQLSAGLISPAEARSQLRNEKIEDAKAAIRQIRIDALAKTLEETE